MPPMRKVRPCGALFAATSVGVKKNTRFSWNALRTSAVTAPSETTPMAMAASRLGLGFTRPAEQENDLQQQSDGRHAVRPPHVPGVASHGEELAHSPRSL